MTRFNILTLALCLFSLKATVASIIDFDDTSDLPSQQCLQAFQGIKDQHKDNDCLPVDKVMPLVVQIKRDPTGSTAQMNQIADIICQQAPVCTPEFIEGFKRDITTHCVGQDATNSLVTGTITLLNNYTPAREMGCLKNSSNGAYCAVEAAQWILKNHPNLDDLDNIQPTKEMCTPCTKGWIEQRDKYAPQYPDLQKEKFLPKLKTVCQSQ
ncbi:hypothetical protein K7432_006607 [Basidiobolus ranarum]|uniref:DUF7729 domain-containing protein n=1 Tax=Basidiobolus ranarum TaxID=34480 RepID=A0ABR2WUL7_9FUNG